jgi:hypothetical protein
MRKSEIKQRVDNFLDDGNIIPKMNQKFKQFWLENLRNGKFNQGNDNLCSVSDSGKKSHCCLGVLGEIIAEKQIKDHKKRINIELKPLRNIYSFNGATGLLPTSISEMVTINLTIQDLLASLNDRGATFKQIADVIEEYL